MTALLFDEKVNYKFVIKELKEASLDQSSIHARCLKKMFGNGRASYVYYEEILREIFQMGQGIGSDHRTSRGVIEQKSYEDPANRKKDYEFYTGASCTFPANNYGKTVGQALRDGNYSQALQIVKETGFNKNDFYVYTNTGKMVLGRSLSAIFLKTSDVLSLISHTDPRKISRQSVLDSALTERFFLVNGDVHEVSEERFRQAESTDSLLELDEIFSIV